MHLSQQIVTVLTTPEKVKNFQGVKDIGGDVWTNRHMSASFAAIKAQRPDAPYKSMRDLYGKYKGETAFICGAGPSLNAAPAKFPGPTFAINRAIKHVKADYWCFADVAATRESADHENAKNAQWCFGAALHLFFPNQPAYLIEANGIPNNYKIEEKRPLYWTGATFSWVLHLAIKTGAKRIIMVGCDFSLTRYFDGAVAYGKENDLMSQAVLMVGRVRLDDMFGPDKHHWFDPNVELLDTSPDGYLPLPKVKLEDYL